ncbi:MAG TPA: CoA pyrophosphatase [Acidimicrobiales bacterium]|nr:CoA pyrophosphatase [Acidimicrobiales bacterium]
MAARAQTPRQQIPRPAGALPGVPPPWSDLPQDRRRAITVDEVVRALAAGRPDRRLEAIEAAGRRVTPSELPEGAGSGPAAVVCLLFDREGETNVVLTRRSAHLRSHSGEVSFPGGRLQPDERPLQAALREANEEIGIEAAAVEVIGHLTPLTRVRSPALVHCFVARFHSPLADRPAFVVNPGEVEMVFWVPLARLASDGVYHEELWPLPDRSGGAASGLTPYRAVPFFRLDEDIVWGATGRLLTELLGLVLARRMS